MSEGAPNFTVAVGRDPSLLAYSNPDLVVTTNRYEQQAEKEVPTIALNDFLAERGVSRRLLELYDTDLMALLSDPSHLTETGGRVGEDILPHLAAFQAHVYSVIEQMAAGRQIVINPYHSVHAEHWRDKGYIVLGPDNTFALEHARKTTAHALACAPETNVSCLGGEVATTVERARELFEEYGGDVFIASDDDPFFPDNRRVRSVADLDTLREGVPYLITKWKEGAVRSPNTQVLIGESDLLYLGQMDQILHKDVKYGGNTYPPSSPQNVQEQLKAQTLKLARALQAQGYRGVVGFDWIETQEGEIFFAETNPRKNRSSSLLFSILESVNPGLSLAELELRAQQGGSVDIPEIARTKEGLYARMVTVPPSALLEVVDPKYRITEQEVYQRAAESDEPVVAVVNIPIAGTAVEAGSANVTRIVGAGKDPAEVERAIADLRRRLFNV